MHYQILKVAILGFKSGFLLISFFNIKPIIGVL